jgi:Ca2+-binding EF-hand superfamily protein
MRSSGRRVQAHRGLSPQADDTSLSTSPTDANSFLHLASRQELQEWRSLFDAHDRARTGLVSTQSLGLMLRASGAVFNSDQLTHFIAYADITRTNVIRFEEFTALQLHRKRRAELEEHGGTLAHSSSRMLRLIAQLRSGEPDVSLEPVGAMPPPVLLDATNATAGGDDDRFDGGDAGDAVGTERWQLLSVIDELWSTRAARSLDLMQLGRILDGPCLSELCRAIAFSPTLRLEELNLKGLPLGDEGAITLSSMLAHTGHLRALRLESCGLGSAGASALLRALRVSNRTLQRLSLAGNAQLEEGSSLLIELHEALRDNAAREALQQAPCHLPRLMLAGRGLASRHMGWLRETLVARLSTKVSTKADAADARASIAEGAAAASPSASAAPPLVRTLNLSLNASCGDALASLLVCRGAANVDELVLEWAEQHATTAPQLRTALERTDTQLAAALTQLHTLCLQRMGLSDAGGAALAAALHSRCLPSLVELDLRHNALGSRLGEAEPLRTATAPAAIPTAALLPVSQASLSVAAALGFAIAVQGVRRLRLDGNPNLSDAGAAWILRNCLQPKRCPAVITLSGTGAGDEAARAVASALSEGAPCASLLLGDLVGDAGAASLAEALRQGCALRELALGMCVGDAGVAALATALAAPVSTRGGGLERLCLGGIHAKVAVCNSLIGAASGAHLAAALRANGTLTQLELCGASLGDAGCASLLDGLAHNTCLTSVDLAHCGADVLALGALHTTLQTNWRLRHVALRPKPPARPQSLRHLADEPGFVEKGSAMGFVEKGSGRKPGRKPALTLEQRRAALTIFACLQYVGQRRRQLRRQQALLPEREALAALLVENATKGQQRLVEQAAEARVLAATACLDGCQPIFATLLANIPPAVRLTEWGPEHCAAFVRNLGLPCYAPAFGSNLNGAKLSTLTIDQLPQLGVNDFGHQRTVLRGVEKAREALATFANLQAAVLSAERLRVAANSSGAVSGAQAAVAGARRGEIMVVLADFAPEGAGEMSCKAQELVRFVRQPPEALDWALCQRLHDDAKGLVPASYLRRADGLGKTAPVASRTAVIDSLPPPTSDFLAIQAVPDERGHRTLGTARLHRAVAGFTWPTGAAAAVAIHAAAQHAHSAAGPTPWRRGEHLHARQPPPWRRAVELPSHRPGAPQARPPQLTPTSAGAVCTTGQSMQPPAPAADTCSAAAIANSPTAAVAATPSSVSAAQVGAHVGVGFPSGAVPSGAVPSGAVPSGAVPSGAVGVEALRKVLLSKMNRVIDLFRKLDANGDRKVTCAEFRRVLPLVASSVGHASRSGSDAPPMSELDVMTPPISELDVDSLFALLDVDGSGSIEYSELHARLRQGLNVTLEKKLQVGAAGEIVIEAKNRVALRDVAREYEPRETLATARGTFATPVGVHLDVSEAGPRARALLCPQSASGSARAEPDPATQLPLELPLGAAARPQTARARLGAASGVHADCAPHQQTARARLGAAPEAAAVSVASIPSPWLHQPPERTPRTAGGWDALGLVPPSPSGVDGAAAPGPAREVRGHTQDHLRAKGSSLDAPGALAVGIAFDSATALGVRRLQPKRLAVLNALGLGGKVANGWSLSMHLASNQHPLRPPPRPPSRPKPTIGTPRGKPEAEWPVSSHAAPVRPKRAVSAPAAPEAKDPVQPTWATVAAEGRLR